MRRIYASERPLGIVIAEKIHEEALAKGPKPTALGTRFRHSAALSCARALGLAALTVPQEPMDHAGHWVTNLGTQIHEWTQQAVIESIDTLDAQVEVELAVRSFAEGSGSLDIKVTMSDGYVIVWELKSCNGTKYRKIHSSGQPPMSNKVQAALNGLGADADEVRLTYIATEAIGLNKGAHGIDRFICEFSMPRAEYEPLAKTEVARVETILRGVDAGFIPDRLFPKEAQPYLSSKVDPNHAVWPCFYCGYRDLCLKLGPGEVPVDAL